MAILNKEKIEIVYEDKWILVLNKPAGWVTTKENDKSQMTGDKNMYIENWVRENRPNGLPREGIVHRLDKGTSGLLVVAKDKGSLEILKKQFKQRKTAKYYLALTGGDLPKDGKIKMPIERSKYVFGRFGVGVDGKMAETEFKVLKKIKIEGKLYSLVEVHLLTGRTHQIRVHFNYLGWPLLGDKIYGGNMKGGVARPFLHATRLRIYHPQNGKEMNFQCELPVDLENVIKNNEV